MWWHKTSQQVDREDTRIADERLLDILAENIIRQKLFFQRNYNPTSLQIKQALTKTRKCIENKYGNNINVFRNKAKAENLLPIIKSCVNEALR